MKAAELNLTCPFGPDTNTAARPPDFHSMSKGGGGNTVLLVTHILCVVDILNKFIKMDQMCNVHSHVILLFMTPLPIWPMANGTCSSILRERLAASPSVFKRLAQGHVELAKPRGSNRQSSD